MKKVMFSAFWPVLVCIVFTCMTCVLCEDSRMFHNQFAVLVPSGKEAADRIAAKHGFTNIGQIGSLENYFLFEHQHIRKRSVNASPQHHEKLSSEPEVEWVEQQHERKRVKRDYVSDLKLFPFPYDTARTTYTQRHHNQDRAIGPYNYYPDPLFKEQWYMNGGAKDGFDMNVQPAWKKGYTGKGVVVSILDDGIQPNHPDLAFNYDPQASTDINDNDEDPMPRDNGDNKHGTRCAGEVAAVAFNNFCGVGVAYNASIGGVRMLDGTVNDAVEARALGLHPDHIDIYSASWGPEDDGKTVDGPGPLARRAFIYGVTSGRRGKGSIFVWASGNGGRHTDSCNCDGYTNSIFTLSISSATQGGFKPWYLEECSSTLATTYSSGTPGHDKSVATVDMDGKLRPDHICTVEHTGTSASAPLAAGICALALEANPTLTWRDMQYLVVLSSRSGPLEKESGWITNGVKRKVSHKFGYGLMDAAAMVSLAEQWTTVPAQRICKSQEIAEDRVIGSNYGEALVTSMDVNGCAGSVNEVRFLEHVQCRVTLRFFPRGNLRILLTSPMGTTSTLLFERPRDVVSSNFDDWPFLSVHFWGEKAEGRWTLQIINAGNRHVNQAGVLKKWQLIFYGTSTNPIRLRNDYGQGSAAQTLAAYAQSPTGNGFVFPSGSSAVPQGSAYEVYGSQSLQDYPGLFSAQGSNIQTSVASASSDRNAAGGATSDVETENLMGAAEDSSKRILHDCDAECDKQGCYGKGPTQCIACLHYRLDNTCVKRCPPRSFANSRDRCWPCHESCDTCAGAGQDGCLTCAPAHLKVTDLGVCLQQCPEGYYGNYDNSTCVRCKENCASCQDRADFCTSCDHHLVLYNNSCLAACPSHSYETDDYNCAPCHESCETCSGPGANQCVTCPSGQFSAPNSQCVSTCPDGFYADKKRRECMPCPTGCTTCNSAVCLSCKPGWSLNKKERCAPNHPATCRPNEFFVAAIGACNSCDTSCETCSEGSQDSCLSCVSPLVLSNGRCVSECSNGTYLERGQCSPCLHTCVACGSRQNCTKCVKGLHLQSGECRTTCAAGYYSDVGVCRKCHMTCGTCSGPRRDQCVTCPAGWQLASGECHAECPEGFFKTEFGCEKCHHYCRTCKGEGPLQCTSCPPMYTLEDGLCMECLSEQYYEPATQLCKQCAEPCRTCSGPGPESCTSCSQPLYIDTRSKRCLPCCSSSSTDQADCCVCDSATGKCASPGEGKRRIPEKAQYLGMLLDAIEGGHTSGNADSETGQISALTVMASSALVVFIVVAAVLSVIQMRSKVSKVQPSTWRAQSRRREKGDSGEGVVLLQAESGDEEDSSNEDEIYSVESVRT